MDALDLIENQMPLTVGILLSWVCLVVAISFLLKRLRRSDEKIVDFESQIDLWKYALKEFGGASIVFDREGTIHNYFGPLFKKFGYDDKLKGHNLFDIIYSDLGGVIDPDIIGEWREGYFKQVSETSSTIQKKTAKHSISHFSSESSLKNDFG